MEETDFFLAAIADQYELHQVTLHPLRRSSPKGKRLYRVDHRDGSSWVLRAYHPDFARNIHCHFDQIDLPEYRPDPTRIAAVIQGYYRWRPLPRKELDVLLEAIRFSIAWRGFGLLDLAEGQQLSEARLRSLTEWWRWYAISDEIARLALDIVGSNLPR